MIIGNSEAVMVMFAQLFPRLYGQSAGGVQGQPAVGVASVRRLSPVDAQCLRDAQSHLRPFGEIPRRLAAALARSLDAARALLSSVTLAVQVVISSSSHIIFYLLIEFLFFSIDCIFSFKYCYYYDSINCWNFMIYILFSGIFQNYIQCDFIICIILHHFIEFLNSMKFSYKLFKLHFIKLNELFMLYHIEL